MYLLRPTFNVLTVVGCWKPVSWTSTYERRAYDFYTSFIFILNHTFTISQFLDMVLNVGNPDEFTDNIYMLLATLLACIKINTLLINRGNIKMLVKALNREPCKPRDAEEVEIQKKFDHSIGARTIHYIIMVEGTVACMILSSFLTNFRDRKLAYRAWLPYDYSTSALYLVAYSHQILGLIITSLANVACDCIICGLLVHGCGQIEILNHRLKLIMPNGKHDLGQCVRHHNFIYRYAYVVNQKFRIMISMQFLISTLVVCFNLYEISNTTPTSSKFIEFVLYMICMMTQIFIYCWYGNQLKLKSREVIYAIFEMDWLSFDLSMRKSLTMIMRRGTRPIEFSSARIIVMDLQTFVNILKMSYSTYNLLQNTKS